MVLGTAECAVTIMAVSMPVIRMLVKAELEKDDHLPKSVRLNPVIRPEFTSSRVRNLNGGYTRAKGSAFRGPY